MKKNLSTLFGALLALALLATACGGSDSAGPGDQELIDAISAQITEEGDFGSDAGDADCVAKAFVNGAGGAEELAAEFGLSVQEVIDGKDIDDVEFSKDTSLSIADDMMDCGLLDLMADEIAGDGVSAEDAKCLVEKLDQDALRDTFASEFMSEADGEALGSAAEGKLTESMLGAFGDCDIDLASLGN